MAEIDPRLKEILSKYHDNPAKAVWNCHGTWVAYHKALESIAARAGIKFDAPMIVESNGHMGCYSMVVTGHLGDRTEWSIGEASSSNCKNAYPAAMAEKRAKDRVILKLLGLHGEIYSEEESDDFKPGASAPMRSRMPAAAAKRLGINDLLKEWVGRCMTELDLDKLTDDTSVLRAVLPESWQDSVTDIFEHRRAEINEAPINTLAAG